MAAALLSAACTPQEPVATHSTPIEKGRYLATIGVCEACHTPPAVPAQKPSTPSLAEEQLRSDPDWFAYLDGKRRFAGGVPFIIRLSGTSHGVVYTPNITPDVPTGIGSWTKAQIVEALRTGKRPDGSVIFLFAPHTFFKHLAVDDADALASYLKSLPAISHKVNARDLPFPPAPAAPVAVPARAPTGATPERAEYLTRALVGCRECHSYTDRSGTHHDWVGGDRMDPFNGTFRLGPDLPLRQEERGVAAFPYPGFAVLFGSNLTRFGKGGDLQNVPESQLKHAIRGGVAPGHDKYGRAVPLEHVMMWQFYRKMSDDDVNAITAHVKNLTYTPHKSPRLVYFGTEWEAAFEYVFGEKPTAADRQAFGKP